MVYWRKNSCGRRKVLSTRYGEKAKEHRSIKRRSFEFIAWHLWEMLYLVKIRAYRVVILYVPSHLYCGVGDIYDIICKHRIDTVTESKEF